MQVTDEKSHQNFRRTSYTMAYSDLKQIQGKKITSFVPCGGNLMIAEQMRRNCECHCAVEQWLSVGLVTTGLGFESH